MAKYIFLATYSDEATKGIVSGDSDRVAAVKDLCDSLGIRMISAELTRGEYDICIIVEADSFAKVAAMNLTFRSRGVVGDKLVTLETVNIEEIRNAAKGAQYTPPSG